MPESTVDVPVIIIQTTSYARERCLMDLNKAGLRENEDFVLCANEHRAESVINPNRKQLLVTGSFNGNIADAEDFIIKMQQRHPLLKTAGFTATDINLSPCDMHISKDSPDGFCAELISTIRQFLNQ